MWAGGGLLYGLPEESSVRGAETSPCLFSVNNMTQLDAKLGHSLNKDRGRIGILTFHGSNGLKTAGYVTPAG